MSAIINIRLVRYLLVAFWFAGAGLILSGCTTRAGKDKAGTGLTSRGGVPDRVFDYDVKKDHALLYQVMTQYLPPDQVRDFTKNEDIMGALRSGNTQAAIKAIERTAQSALQDLTKASTRTEERFALIPMQSATDDVQEVTRDFFRYSDEPTRGSLMETENITRVEQLTDPEVLADLEARLRDAIRAEIEAAQPAPQEPALRSQEQRDGEGGTSDPGPQTSDFNPRPGFLSWIPVTPDRVELWVPKEWDVAGLTLRRDADFRVEVLRAAVPEESRHHLYPVDLNEITWRPTIAMYSDPARKRESAGEVGFDSGNGWKTKRYDWSTPNAVADDWVGPRK